MIIEGREGDAPPFVEPPAPHAQGPVALDSFRRGRADSASEVARIAAVLDSLAARLEASEHRSTLAITGIDQSVMGVLSRIEGVERDQTSIAARFDVNLQDVKDAQAKIADKLRRMDEADAPRAEAMRALEAALGKVAGQMHETEARNRAGFNEVREDIQGVTRRVDRLDARLQGGAEEVIERFAARLEAAESKTHDAIKSLEAGFAGLDARISSTEARAVTPDADPAVSRFERLALDLADKVEATRAEMNERLKQAADGKLDRMEAALRNLADHVEAGEKRQAQAVDRMGREVMKIAQTLGGRVQAVEGRSAKMVEQVGGEMARIADAMEGRMRAADGAQAEALEKLGTEIARIAEKLADRIAGAERRSAQAIDDVGDQVARVTEKINSRYERASTDLAERIRQSEERTAKMLEEARGKFGLLGGGVIPAQSQAQPVSFDPFPAAPAEFASEPGESAPDVMQAEPQSGQDPFPAAAAFEEPVFEQASGPAFEDDPFAASSGFPSGADAFALPHEAAAADPAFDPAPVPFTPPPTPVIPAMAEPASFAPPPSSNPNRDLIEAARAAARQASAADGRGRRVRSEMDTPAPPSEGGRFSGFRLPKKKKKDAAPTLRTALLASATAMAITGMVVGGFLLKSETQQTASASGDPVLSGSSASAEQPVQAAVALSEPTSDLAPTASLDQVAPLPAPAMSVATGAAPATGPAAAVKPAVDGSAKALYSKAVGQIESGDYTGVEALRRAANLGYAQAQFYLAKLYEGGTAGIKKDVAEARRWTERAAQGGDPKAMHNLALYYFEGTGGEKNPTTASTWFRRAADLGLQDSQYNLARLYEEGYGVAQNPAEAYKWYLISGAGGDTESKTSADRLKAKLSPEAQLAAQRSAAAYRAQISGARVAVQ